MRKHPRDVYEPFGPVLETSLAMVSLQPALYHKVLFAHLSEHS